MTYTLAFDVYGTLIDTTGVFHSLEKIIGSKAKTFVDTWRNKQLEYSFRRGLMDLYADFSVCTNDSLEFCCKKFKTELTEKQKETLMNEYKILPTFPDVKKGLMDLKLAGHKLYAFSNGSHTAIFKLLEHAEIISVFEGIISVEDIQTFKPSPDVYTHFCKKTQSKKSNTWLISSNPFDVIGAVSYGMKSAWIQRGPDSIFDPWGIEPTILINSLTELCNKLQ